MFDDLDAVDWSRLTHAYGEATNVPALLRALASADRDERETALDGLFWTIYHQGTIYDATAPAAPFLLRLVGDPATPDRHRLLELLAAIAGGCGYLQVHQTLTTVGVPEAAAVQQTLAAERAVQRAIRDAVWDGWPLFVDLLQHEEPALREQARQVLRRLIEYPRADLCDLLGRLATCLEDVDHPERAGVLLLLGEAVRFHADPAAALRAAVDHRDHETERSNMADLHPDDGLPVWLELSADDQARGRAATAVLWSYWPTIDRLVADPDPAVPEGALFLQAMLVKYGRPPGSIPPVVPRWFDRLAAATDERDAVNLVFALGLVASDDSSVLPAALRQTLQQTRSPLVGYVAALKLVDRMGRLDDGGLDRLLDVYREPRAVYEQLQAMPRWEPYWADDRLQRLGPAVVDRRLPVFVDMVRTAGRGYGDGGRVRDLFRLAFGDRKLPPGATVDDLTAAQRVLLHAAADNGYFWTNMANLRFELGRLFGLPDDRRALRRFLARPGEPPAPPRNDPEEALIQFERLVAAQLPFEQGISPYTREEGDPRAPFRMIQEGVEAMARATEAYRPKDRPRITRLAPQGYADDALAALLPLCPNLEDLDLSYGEVTDAGLAPLARLARLERLNLSANPITDAGLAALAGLIHLHDLNLWGTDVGDAGLSHLAALVGLKKLNLAGTRFGGAGLHALHRVEALEEMWLGTDHLTDAVVPAVAAFRRLRSLSLGGDRFTGAGLACWAELTTLTELWFHLPRAAATLADLPSLPALERLNLGGNGVGDAHVRALPALPALKQLTLPQAGVTAAALDGLDRFPALEGLDLSWTAVTDAIVPYLLRCTGLKWVGLFQTAVSDPAVDELRRAFPEAHFRR